MSTTYSIEAAKTSLTVLCALRDTAGLHPNMVKDIDFAIDLNQLALAECDSSLPIELVDRGWYWVRYEGLDKVYVAPARYHADVDCWYSFDFSGIPSRQAQVLQPINPHLCEV